MLQFLDVLLSITHLAIVGFNLFGWIPPATRKLHFISVLVTAASWFLLGIWFGMGYCPITDWQWRVKERLGEKNLPSQFYRIFSEKITGRDLSSQFITYLTGICFTLVVVVSIYLNFFKTKRR